MKCLSLSGKITNQYKSFEVSQISYLILLFLEFVALFVALLHFPLADALRPRPVGSVLTTGPNAPYIYLSCRRYDLDLRLSDHRRIARVLSEMAVTEPGPNLQNQQFRSVRAA